MSYANALRKPIGFDFKNAYFPDLKESVKGKIKEPKSIPPKVTIVEKKECSICQDTINGDLIRLPCNHHFHQGCIYEWFEIRNTCPLCREIIDKNSLYREREFFVSDFPMLV